MAPTRNFEKALGSYFINKFKTILHCGELPQMYEIKKDPQCLLAPQNQTTNTRYKIKQNSIYREEYRELNASLYMGIYTIF